MNLDRLDPAVSAVAAVVEASDPLSCARFLAPFTSLVNLLRFPAWE